MNKLDLRNWKEFNVIDLFEIEQIVGDLQVPKQIDGDFPLVSSGSNNNGICMYIDTPSEKSKIISGKKITVDMFGKAFYQDFDFYAVAHGRINVLNPKFDINENIGLFMATVIEKRMMQKYGFVDMCSQKALTAETILLPTDTLGKPDYVFMESYIKQTETVAKKSLNTLSNISHIKKPIDTSKFGTFIVEELFDIRPTRSYKMTNTSLLDGGENPVLANSAYNNGIGGYSSQENTEKGNIITFSDTVDANTIFYQENDFIGYSHVQGMYPINEYSDKWSKYSMLYFVSVFKARAKIKGFDYGNKFRRDVALKLDVLLPINDAGKIDFEYMENYMKLIESRAQIQINSLQMLE